MSDTTSLKSRTFMILLYPDNVEHKLTIMQLLSDDFPAVGILHDKDVYSEDTENHVAGELEKPHWHFVLRFSNARHLSSLAKSLSIEERFIQKSCSYVNAVEYLVHRNDPEKFQYSTKELKGSFVVEALKILDNRPIEQKVSSILAYIDTCKGKITTRKLVQWCCDNNLYSVCKSAGWLIRDCVAEHNTEFYYRQLQNQI